MKSQIRQSDFTFTFHFHALEKEMVTHSNFLAWRIPGTGEPSGLPSMGVAQSWTQLSNFHFLGYPAISHFERIKNTVTAMAPHSSTLAWKIPLAEESGRLQSRGS